MSCKYIITDQGEVVIGMNTYHQNMASDANIKGKVVRAGHCRHYDIGWDVFGESYGYGIKAQPEDAKIINNCENIIHV